MKKLINALKNNKADQYIQFIICTVIGIVLVVSVMSLGTLYVQKVWLNDKLSDMSRIISVTGSYKDAEIYAIEDEVIDKLGGSFSYSGDILDTASGKVQLGSVVKINYKTEIAVFSIGDAVINADVDLNKNAISEVYFKE